MGNPSSIQWSMWLCLAGITGVPFYFKNWLDRTRPILAVNVQEKTTRLSYLIFALLFLGGFIFNQKSQNAAMMLLFAAVVSFSFLYQFAGRYQIALNRAKPEPLAAHGASLRRNAARLAAGILLCMLMSKLSLLVLFLPFILPFFIPIFVRLQHSCTAMADSNLRSAILARFEQEGSPLSGIFIIDEPESTLKNAFITGSPLGAGAFGQTLFITLPLIRELNESEIMAVVLHEAAHAKRNHGFKRILISVLLMVASAFWITLPVIFLFPKSLLAIGISVIFAVFLQAFLLSRVIAKQEHQADLMAVHMGASSNALVAAIEKVSAGKVETQNPLLRILSGNLYPTVRSRIDAIVSCDVPDSTRLFRSPSSTLAYSLLVLGVVFWAANVRVQPANISHSEERVVSR